jgi:hypothetical protein
MTILLEDFNAKVDREDTFKPTIGNEILHKISNDNGVRVVNFATPKKLIDKSTIFPHRNIHNYTWTSPDGKTYSQIDCQELNEVEVKDKYRAEASERFAALEDLAQRLKLMLSGKG